MKCINACQCSRMEMCKPKGIITNFFFNYIYFYLILFIYLLVKVHV